jgi:hypothetical protein
MPVFKAKGNKPCIIIPLMPRYLFSRCCNNNSYCINVNESNFSTTLLSGFIRLRNELIKHLVQNGLTDFNVMDTCCTTTCTQTASIQDRLEELKKVLSNDGVHYSTIGYKNLAEKEQQSVWEPS